MDNQLEEVVRVMRDAANSLHQLMQPHNGARPSGPRQPRSAQVTQPSTSRQPQPSTSRQPHPAAPAHEPEPSTSGQPRRADEQQASTSRQPQEPQPSNIQRYRSIFRRPNQQNNAQLARPPRSNMAASHGNPSPSGLQRQRRVNRRTLNKRVVLLANRDDCTVPDVETKALLKRCGLGEKKVELPVDADAGEFQELLYEAFPMLRGCGGYELMRTKEGSRSKLFVVWVGACSVDDIRSFSAERFYIRPIQKDFGLDEEDQVSNACERCQHCSMNIPLSLLRDHVDECSEESDTAQVEQDQLPEVSLLPDQPPVPATPASPPTSQTETTQIPHAAQGTTSTTPSTVPAAYSGSLVETAQSLLDMKVDTAISRIGPSIADDVGQAGSDYLSAFNTAFMEGRMLDSRQWGQQEPDDTDGDVYRVFVCRSTALEDMVSEVMVPDFKAYLPLFVEFLGEEAADYGGPRKELLRIAFEKLAERVFVGKEDGLHLADNPAHIARMYEGAGIIVGLCLLQRGPSTTVFSPELVERLAAGADLDQKTRLFSSGLQRTGILQLVQVYPQCKELLVCKPVPVMRAAKFLSMFVKEFSEEGNNDRLREEATIRLFVKYLRDVDGGNRCVSTADIIQFVTCLRARPAVGFQPKPSIVFQPSRSFLPRAQTCTNTLILPVCRAGADTPTDDVIFNMFDYAFKNAYFGAV